jgi:hypothetical protein
MGFRWVGLLAVLVFSTLSGVAGAAQSDNCDRYAVAMATTPAAPLNANSFGALERFQKELPRSANVVFVGDSLLAQWRDTIEKDFPGLKVWNFSVGQDRTQNVLWRWDQVDASALNPEVVVMLIGTNNLADAGMKGCAIIKGIDLLVKKARSTWPSAPIMLLTLPPRGADFLYQDADRQIVNLWIAGGGAKDPMVFPVQLDDYEMTCGKYGGEPLPKNTLQCFPESRYACANYEADNLHFTAEGRRFVKDALVTASKRTFGADFFSR